MWALLGSTPVEVFVNTALLESGGVVVKGTTIVSITTEPVDLDQGPAAVCMSVCLCPCSHAHVCVRVPVCGASPPPPVHMTARCAVLFT
jgi:hypothetical protein